MAFIAFLFAFIFQRKTQSRLTEVGSLLSKRIGHWIDGLASHHLWIRQGVLVGLLAVLCSATAVVLWSFEGILYDLVYIALLVCIFVFTMGDKASDRAMSAFFAAWKTGDTQMAYREAKNAGANLGAALQSDSVLLRELIRWFATRNARAYLFPIFWCALAGPVVFVFVRCLDFLAQDNQPASVREAALPVSRWVEWVPARIFATGIVVLFARRLRWSSWLSLVFWSRLDTSRVFLIALQLACPVGAAGKPDRMIGQVVTSLERSELQGQHPPEGAIIAGEQSLLRVRTCMSWLVGLSLVVWGGMTAVALIGPLD